MTARSTLVQGADFPLALETRDRIPAERYYDPEFFALEAERLWPRVWQMACRLEELPAVGDWVEYSCLGRSIIVTRVAPDRIKAYHNACRHRGMQIAQGRGHAPTGFTCPFHGWCWDLEGRNRAVFAPDVFDPKLLEPDDIHLAEVRLEIWGGCAWINFDDEAPALRPSLEPFATYHDALGVERMRTESWLVTDLPVNWKLASEAFLEGYHAEQTHPQLLARSVQRGYSAGSDTMGFTDPDDIVGSSIYFMKVLSEGMGGGMVHPRDIEAAEAISGMSLPSDPLEALGLWTTRLNEEIGRRARDRGVDLPDLNALITSGHISSVNFCFPHFWYLPVYGNAASYRIRPIGPEQTRFEVWTTTHMPADTDHVSPREPTEMAHDDPRWGEVLRQDFANLPRQQAGVRSPGFASMRLARDVEGTIGNFHCAVDGYLARRAHADLLPAIQRVSGPIDAALRDLGL
jgi:phenylpropionate dioxygenase-like ring-hydroxylating dioxygenase large terminal subunit